jgi:hypothetical protein
MISVEVRRRAALEGGYLVNEAIRELIAPTRVMELTDYWMGLDPPPLDAIAAVRNMILRTIIVNVYRLQEARDHYLVPWVFSSDELRALGLRDMEAFLGGAAAWKAFALLRHQYAGHATGKARTATSPGRLVPARVLGKAIRDSGLNDLSLFLGRVRTELAPAIEQLRDEIGRRYPDLRRFIQQYAADTSEASNRPPTS